jgi:WD40 repeat protein
VAKCNDTWETVTGEHTTRRQGMRYTNMNYKAGNGKTIRWQKGLNSGIYDKATGDRLSVLEGHTKEIVWYDWSPDNSRVATASNDRTGAIWDVTTGKRLWVLEGHTKEVVSINWSPDESRVATASKDKTVAIWDVVIRKRQMVLHNHTKYVEVESWSPQGNRVAT